MFLWSFDRQHAKILSSLNGQCEGVAFLCLLLKQGCRRCFRSAQKPPSACMFGKRACMFGKRRLRIQSLKMVVKTSHKNQFFYFYVLNSFLKWSPTPYISNSIIETAVKFWQNFDASLKIVLLKFRIDISLESMRFSVSLKFRKF